MTGNGSRLERFAPSASTSAGVTAGVPASVVLLFLFQTYTGIDVPGEVAAAFGALLSQVIGYFLPGGRRRDTENGA